MKRSFLWYIYVRIYLESTIYTHQHCAIWQQEQFSWSIEAHFVQVFSLETITWSGYLKSWTALVCLIRGWISLIRPFCVHAMRPFSFFFYCKGWWVEAKRKQSIPINYDSDTKNLMAKSINCSMGFQRATMWLYTIIYGSLSLSLFPSVAFTCFVHTLCYYSPLHSQHVLKCCTCAYCFKKYGADCIGLLNEY